MATPSHARWIAPVALLIAVLAVAIVYSSSTGGSGSDTSPAEQTSTGGRSETTGKTSTQAAPPRTTTAQTTTTGAETYTVQSGDTLGSIAARTGTTVEELEQANPGVDSSSLTVGQELDLP